MVRRRMFPNDAGTAHTRARPRRLPATSPTAISRLRCRTRNGSRTSPRSRPGMGRCTSPRRSTVTTARSSRTRPGPVPTRSSPTGCSSRPWKRCRREPRPLVHSDRGCHCRRPGWLALMDRYGPARSTGAKGRSPDDATAEGFLGRMRTEPVYPGHWGEHTRDGVLVPIDDCIRWHDHERIKRSIGWMSPVQIPSKPGNGCVIISKKTSAAPLSHLSHIHVDKAQYYIQV